MSKKILLLIIICFLFTGCSSSTTKKDIVVKEISVSEVKEIVDNYSDYSNLYIVDVRTEDEYNTGHIAGSINIPVDNLGQIDVSKDTKIIVYCRSGGRSLAAVDILNEMGYTNVYNMGGLDNWTFDLVN